MNEKGFTLAEVIVAIALVGIVAITFVPILSVQYMNINKTGDKSEATYKAMEDTEEQIEDIQEDIANGNPVVPDSKVTTQTPDGKIIETDAKKATGTGKSKDEESEMSGGVPVPDSNPGDDGNDN